MLGLEIILDGLAFLTTTRERHCYKRFSKTMLNLKSLLMNLQCSVVESRRRIRQRVRFKFLEYKDILFTTTLIPGYVLLKVTDVVSLAVVSQSVRHFGPHLIFSDVTLNK